MYKIPLGVCVHILACVGAGCISQSSALCSSVPRRVLWGKNGGCPLESALSEQTAVVASGDQENWL